jgi:hypothetical protein
MSESVQITNSGQLAKENESPLLWLMKLVNGTNIHPFAGVPHVQITSLDSGKSITKLCMAVRKFMPENFLAAMATCSACIIGAIYIGCGVPVLTGPPGSYKGQKTSP